MSRVTTYYCDDFRSISLGDHIGDTKVKSVADAARAFGARLARRRYGRRAYCRHVNLDCYINNKQFCFDAWIGKPDGTGLKGSNVRLYVTYKIKYEDNNT
jgi:hypothetical protein